MASNTHCTPYSSCSRNATTSNCSCPMAPRIRSLSRNGLKSWVAPSSQSCDRPFCSAFMRKGSLSTARRNSSGAKFGTPVKVRFSPSLKVSPMLMVPWLCNPMMSPAYASSAWLRSAARNEEAYAGDIIGLHNHGTINIGDTFSEGENLTFTGVPNFAPEIFRRAVLKDPLRMKALQKGLSQLCEEGATQLFKPLRNNYLILGAT